MVNARLAVGGRGAFEENEGSVAIKASRNDSALPPGFENSKFVSHWREPAPVAQNGCTFSACTHNRPRRWCPMVAIVSGALSAILGTPFLSLPSRERFLDNLRRNCRQVLPH